MFGGRTVHTILLTLNGKGESNDLMFALDRSFKVSALDGEGLDSDVDVSSEE